MCNEQVVQQKLDCGCIIAYLAFSKSRLKKTSDMNGQEKKSHIKTLVFWGIYKRANALRQGSASSDIVYKLLHSIS